MKLKIKYEGDKRTYFINDFQKTAEVASRLLTGTDYESCIGIFTSTKNETFSKCGIRKEFCLSTLPDIRDSTAFEVEIIRRIEDVRKWVKSLDKGEITIFI